MYFFSFSEEAGIVYYSGISSSAQDDSTRYNDYKKKYMVLINEGFPHLEIDLEVAQALAEESLYFEAIQVLKVGLADTEDIGQISPSSVNKDNLAFTISSGVDYYEYDETDTSLYVYDTVNESSVYDNKPDIYCKVSAQRSFSEYNIENIYSYLKMGSQYRNQFLELKTVFFDGLLDLVFKEEAVQYVNREHKDSSDNIQLGFDVSAEKYFAVFGADIKPFVESQAGIKKFRHERAGYLSYKDYSLKPGIGVGLSNLWFAVSCGILKEKYSHSYDSLDKFIFMPDIILDYFTEKTSISMWASKETEKYIDPGFTGNVFFFSEGTASFFACPWLTFAISGGYETESFGYSDSFYRYADTLFSYPESPLVEVDTVISYTDTYGTVHYDTFKYQREEERAYDSGYYDYYLKGTRKYLTPSVRLNIKQDFSLELKYLVEKSDHPYIKSTGVYVLKDSIPALHDTYLINGFSAEVDYLKDDMIADAGFSVEHYKPSCKTPLRKENTTLVPFVNMAYSFFSSYRISLSGELEYTTYKEDEGTVTNKSFSGVFERDF
ncbi:MAG: hypothetical protein ACLFQK_04355 [Fibrobacterota bacterium]